MACTPALVMSDLETVIYITFFLAIPMELYTY